MAAIEHLIISKVIEEQDISEAIKFGIKPEFFAGEWQDIYKWITAYNREHGAVPSERAFSQAYGDVDIEDTSSETFSGLFDELVEAYKFRVIAQGITEATDALDKGSVDDALSILSKGLAKSNAETSRIKDFNIIEGWEDRLAMYQEMRDNPNALRGIPTGFAGLDRITQGLRPQQYIVMVGEPKRGKSLFELIMANACHYSGRSPLFVSFEMSVQEQLARWDALRAHVDYNAVLTGNLSDKEMDRIERQMRLAKNMQPFHMSEDASGLTTLSAMDAKIQEKRPAALYVDGVYLMDDENGEPKGSPQALTNITRGFKRLAQKWDIPIVNTSQVLSWKLNNKRTRAITADSIGYTSSFVQDADLVLGVERDPDNDNQSIIRVVEARTAPRGTVYVKWDWSTMDFEEVQVDGEVDSAYDD